MTLQAKLDEMKRGFQDKIPAEVMAVMHNATEALLTSDIMKGVLTAGDRMPDFSLSDHTGQTVQSAELLTKGPLVVSFYRGIW